VFRADLPYDFEVHPPTIQHLIDRVDRDLTFAIEVEGGVQRADVTNYDEVREKIVESLEALRDGPRRKEQPLIYHLDVAAMYPNIILTNRLQPSAIVQPSDCAACDFNDVEAGCKRSMNWVWRGDALPASRSEYNAVRTQLQYETVDGVAFESLEPQLQNQKTKARLKEYCKTAYSKTKVTATEARSDTVCQRENPFYVLLHERNNNNNTPPVCALCHTSPLALFTTWRSKHCQSVSRPPVRLQDSHQKVKKRAGQSGDCGGRAGDQSSRGSRSPL